VAGELEQRTDRAFAFASDSCKQLITLATGVTALTITFQKDVFTGLPQSGKWLLGVGWLSYLISILLGVATLNNLVGQLQPKRDESVPKPSVYDKKVVGWSIAQIIAFLIATVLVTVAGVIGLSANLPAVPAK
jgi:hypothetical protein